MSDADILTQRLAALPPKVATPFRKLLEAHQISQDSLSVILDAAQLTGDHDRLLGFAIAYMHLRSSGVPVHNVIEMAKNQKTRINLAWSAKRWKAEHDRLSRAEALARLATQNVSYDVSTFEAHLPKKFDGYLIRSSRRLGMEGLRQRHCVASYHSQLQSASCAIAAVFVDKKRWTVQLFTTDKPDAPLRIGQIKTRLNAVPPPDVRERIYGMFGVELPRTPDLLSVQDDPSYLDTLRRLLPVLHQHGIQNVTVSFEGSGDSGQIEDISYHPSHGFDPKTATIEHHVSTSQFEDGQWVRTTALTRTSINEAVDELTYSYLQETGVDWYNNDGGYGELVIDVAHGTFSLDINVRYTESTCEHSSQRDIATGEAC